MDIVRHEFLSVGSALQNHSADRSRDVVCATGPGLLTATVKAAIIKHQLGTGPHFPSVL